MRLRSLAAASSAALVVSLAGTASAQSEGGFALSQFEPAPAGDPFFGVPSPAAPGHLDPRGQVMFDYAHIPIRLRAEDVAIVSSQGFLRFNAALPLWKRLLVSLEFPMVVNQAGEDPGLTDTTFPALEAPQAGDLRIGLRGRIWGEDATPFQLGGGGYMFAPTGTQDQYAGDGGFRGALHLAMGGRVGTSVALLWGVAAGVVLRASDSPHAFTYSAGAGLVFADDVVQIGPEIYGATPLSGDLPLASIPVVETAAGTNAELLFGTKIRVLDGLTFGGAIGPGLSNSVGTPAFRALGTLGWTPLPRPKGSDEPDEPEAAGDQDDDGITDDIDACPDVPGDPNPDPAKDGCPPDDRDGDGILDVEDACPGTPGLRNVDATMNGCPEDSDADGVHDGIDACPKIPGELSEDPTQNGCPLDRDGDGIADGRDACPSVKGGPSDDPANDGCPDDPDGDGIRFAADACPTAAGPADPRPERNGCPRGATPAVAAQDELGPRILFGVSKTEIDNVIRQLTDGVVDQVRGALADPSVAHIEVQGHTDDSGEEDVNGTVSRKRAENVRGWLISRGIPADKLVAKGYSYTKPVADNRIRQGRRLNRRVQFVAVKK